MNETHTDTDIRNRLNADDPSALELIWNQYASDLLAYLASLLNSHHEAEDVLQETFVTISQKRSSVAAARSLKSYLFSMTRNIAFNRIKRRKRMEQHHDNAQAWLVLQNETGTEGDRSQELTTSLSLLPETQRTVVVMHVYRDKTLRDIGELLGISQNTVASRYRYGIEKLRELMRRNL